MIEFDSVEQAIATYESPAYQAAVAVLKGAVEREIRIVEGAPAIAGIRQILPDRETGSASTGELMASGRKTPKSIDEYIAAFSPDVRAILERIRSTIRRAAPGAQETISYRIPAFTLNGTLVYFAAFKNHIGFYPPVRGDARLKKAISRYAGEKGNLRFPLDQPIPYGLDRENREAAGEAERRKGGCKKGEEAKGLVTPARA